MWSAFITGAATQASKLIEEEDERIKKKLDIKLKDMYDAAEDTKRRATSRKDELESSARELMSLGVPEASVAQMLQNVGPEGTKNVLTILKKQAEKGIISKEKLAQLTAGVPAATGTLQDIISTQTTPTAKAVSAPEMRGAFGLPSRMAGEFAEQASTIRTELPSIKPTAAAVDLSAFAEPEAIGDIQNRLRDAIANGEPLTSPANAKMLKQLEAAVLIKETVEGDESLKPRSTSQINTVIDKTLRAGLEPFVLKGIVRFDTASNEYVPITGNRAALKQFFDHKNTIIRNQAEALGIIKDGRAIDRNARDALLPYANIDKDGKIASWKTVEAPAAPPPAPETPAKGASAPATPAKTNAANIDRLRADANAKIAQNPALASRVRAAFKRETGQDL